MNIASEEEKDKEEQSEKDKKKMPIVKIPLHSWKKGENGC